jgi:WD40 repeat protein
MSKLVRREPRTIIWSPHQADLFAVGGQDFRLYHALDENVTYFRGARRAQMERLNIITYDELHIKDINYQYISCLAWSPDYKTPDLVACGTSNGRVVLLNAHHRGTTEERRKELTYRAANSQRQVTAMAWNPLNHNQLLVGYHRGPQDPAMIIWDVTRGRETFVGKDHSGEGASSVAWRHEHSFLFGNQMSKYASLVDIRLRNTAAKKPVSEKANVLGVQFDPFDSNIFMTFSEGEPVRFWDIRSFTGQKTLFTISPTNERNHLVKTVQAAFCPTQKSLFVTVGEEEKCFRLWDLSATVSRMQEKSSDTKSPFYRYLQTSVTLFNILMV